MMTFKFKENVDDKINEIKEFVDNHKDISKIKIVYEINSETTMQEMHNVVEKIFDNLPVDVQVEFSEIVNEEPTENENIVTLDFE